MIDLLVLSARYCRSARLVLFSHGLAGSLGRAAEPIVVNFGAASRPVPVRWHDLQLERYYHGVGAMGHAARLNDLLGVRFTGLHPHIRYVLNHRGTGGHAGDLPR